MKGMLPVIPLRLYAYFFHNDNKISLEQAFFKSVYWS